MGHDGDKELISLDGIRVDRGTVPTQTKIIRSRSPGAPHRSYESERPLLSHVNESDDELELTGIMNGGSGGGSGGTAPKDASSSSLEMEKVSTQGPTAPLDGEIDNLDSTVVSASTSGEVERREKLAQLAAQRQAMDAEIARAAAHTEAEVVLQEPSADSSGGGGVETGDGNGAPKASGGGGGRGRGDDEEADLGGAEDDEEEKEKEEKEPLKYFARGAEQEPQCVCRCEGSTRAER